MVYVDDANDQQRLCHHVIKIKKFCSKVIKGYSKHYEEINSHPLPEQSLNEIKLLFDQYRAQMCQIQSDQRGGGAIETKQ
jgi:hypothetical protein